MVSKLERLIPDKTPKYMRHLYRLHEARYKFATDSVASKRVLDVATGAGYGAALLADAGASMVIGVDISQEAIRYAQVRYAHANVHYVIADAVAIPLANASVDVVVSFETIEHLDREKIESFLQELVRVIKPGGEVFISTPNGEASYRLGAYHTVEFSLAEFRALLDRHLPKVILYAQRRIPGWYLTLFGTARKLPLIWRLDAIARLVFFSSSRIDDYAIGRARPMFLIARCVSSE